MHSFIKHEHKGYFNPFIKTPHKQQSEKNSKGKLGEKIIITKI